MDLIELYKPMIKAIIKKYLSYANKIGLDYDDLFQEASMAVLRAENTYKNNKNMKLETWIYNNVEWQLQRALKKNSKYKDITSLQTSLNASEDDNITLEDTLIDDRVDIEAQVYDGMVKDIYKREIEKYIDGKKLDVCILRWFNNCSYKYISTVTEINNVSGILMDARATLIRRSPLLRAEFFKLHGMDSYSDAARVVI